MELIVVLLKMNTVSLDSKLMKKSNRSLSSSRFLLTSLFEAAIALLYILLTRA